jgi:hypothetical protein
MRSHWRSIGIGILMSVLCLGAALFTLRATAQSKSTAPSTEEESATIKDDPTIAPDPKQSSDNNISFPTDI